MREDLLPVTHDGIISRLIEEAAETIKAAAKLQRFGYYAVDPKTGIKYDNIEDLKSELQDLKHSINQVESLFG